MKLFSRIAALFKHEHRWEETLWNRYGIAVEEQCKCGAARYHKLEHTKEYLSYPNWQDGLHPNRPKDTADVQSR